LRAGERIRNQSAGENVARDMVGLMVSQRAAEANLAVARVADETSESLISRHRVRTIKAEPGSADGQNIGVAVSWLSGK